MMTPLKELHSGIAVVTAGGPSMTMRNSKRLPVSYLHPAVIASVMIMVIQIIK